MHKLVNVLRFVLVTMIVMFGSVRTSCGDCSDNSFCFAPPGTTDSCGGECGGSCFGMTGLPPGASYCTAVAMHEEMCCYAYTVTVTLYNDGTCDNGPLCSCSFDPDDPVVGDIGICWY